MASTAGIAPREGGMDRVSLPTWPNTAPEHLRSSVDQFAERHC